MQEQSIETGMTKSAYGSNSRLPQMMSVDLWDVQDIFQGKRVSRTTLQVIS